MKNKKVLYNSISIIVFVIGVVLSSVISYNIGYNNASIKNNQNTIDTSSTQPVTEAIEEMVIDTPYCKLYYPKKWEDSLKVNKKTDEPYTVEFYATIEKSDFHLFDFIFNGTDGVLIGELTTDDGSAVKVNVNSYELEIDKLSEDEISNLYLMQEDINYILQKLIAEDNFQEVTN